MGWLTVKLACIKSSTQRVAAVGKRLTESMLTVEIVPSISTVLSARPAERHWTVSCPSHFGVHSLALIPCGLCELNSVVDWWLFCVCVCAEVDKLKV